uniref:Maturase K n=1 Tax=Romanomermis culicivorax TaxID=13658 RepID=A0A915JDI3_ROMCU
MPRDSKFHIYNFERLKHAVLYNHYTEDYGYLKLQLSTEARARRESFLELEMKILQFNLYKARSPSHLNIQILNNTLMEQFHENL